MKKGIVILSGCLLLLSGLYLLKRNQVLKQRFRDSLVHIDRLNRVNQQHVSKLNQLTGYSIEDFSSYLNLIVTDTAHKAHQLADFTGKGFKLIYRLPDNCIGKCYECPFEQIRVLGERIGNDHIIFLVSPGRGNFKRMYGEAGLPVRMLFVDSCALFAFKPERLQAPYLFFLDETFQARYIFTPEKAIPDLTTAYFEKIGQLFRPFVKRKPPDERW